MTFVDESPISPTAAKDASALDRSESLLFSTPLEEGEQVVAAAVGAQAHSLCQTKDQTLSKQLDLAACHQMAFGMNVTPVCASIASRTRRSLYSSWANPP
jgi:hypothetical protein